jgi:hypothetical protein
MTDTCVAGEPAETLLQALRQIKWKNGPDGMATGSARLEPRLGHPLFRALMRVQAELMLDDADRLGSETSEDRTHEQRAADALVALADRVVDAIAASQ